VSPHTPSWVAFIITLRSCKTYQNAGKARQLTQAHTHLVHHAPPPPLLLSRPPTPLQTIAGSDVVAEIELYECMYLDGIRLAFSRALDGRAGASRLFYAEKARCLCIHCGFVGWLSVYPIN
jgi:hypothetical protein